MGEATAMEFNFLISLEDKSSAKKRVCIYEEDDLILRSTKTLDYFKLKADKSIDLLLDESAQDSKQSSALK